MGEKSIVEKLGITPGPWGIVCCDGFQINHYSEESNCRPVHAETWSRENADIIASAPEMLEALIDIRIYLQAKCAPSIKRRSTVDERMASYEMGKVDCVIEKATGKTWEQIKELL